MKENYRDIDKINQSLLKKLLIHPVEYLKAKDKQESDEVEKKHNVFGSMVDILCLSPERFDKEFYVMEEADISDALKSISSMIMEMAELEGLDIPILSKEHNSPVDHIILEVAEKFNYQSNWKNDTKVKKIKESCGGYISKLVFAKGRTIVSTEEYQKAITCSMMLKSDPGTKYYFKPKKGEVLLFHKVVQFEFEGIEIKCELDIIRINHDSKIIYPADLKTIGSQIYRFNSDFWKFRYDFQAGTYFLGLFSDPTIKELLEKGYKIAPFRFIVGHSDSDYSPLVFKVGESAHNIAISGGVLSDGRRLEGLTQAVKRYKFHIKEDKWDYPMEYYQNKILNIEI